MVRRDDYAGFSSEISNIHSGKPTQEIEDATPEYYRRLGISSSLWFALCTPLEPFDLRNLQLLSNKRPLLNVMRECRTSSMLVEIAATGAGKTTPGH